jgi:hypothetical protein
MYIVEVGFFINEVVSYNKNIIVIFETAWLSDVQFGNFSLIKPASDG